MLIVLFAYSFFGSIILVYAFENSRNRWLQRLSTLPVYEGRMRVATWSSAKGKRDAMTCISSTNTQWKSWRKSFPIFKKLDAGLIPSTGCEGENVKKYIYMDSAATTQRCKESVEAMTKFYTEYNANVHRSDHRLGAYATDQYEAARKVVAQFINADAQEVIFVKNATEGLNLISTCVGNKYLAENDTVLLSEAEHHSNIVPWQMLASRKGIIIKYIPLCRKTQTLDMQVFLDMLIKLKPKVLAVQAASNVLGYINDYHFMMKVAKEYGVQFTVLDCCQLAAHQQIDVKRIDCDFLVLSGHKMFGPMGAGVVYGKANILKDIPPFFGGGEMINNVTFKTFQPAAIPFKLEAGTPCVPQALGLAKAIQFINQISFKNIRKYEEMLAQSLYNEMEKIPNCEIFGPHMNFSEGKIQRLPLVAMNFKNINAYDIAAYLDMMGIAVRAGHHCCQPLHEQVLGISGSLRASLSIYNTEKDIQRLASCLQETFNNMKYKKIVLHPSFSKITGNTL